LKKLLCALSVSALMVGATFGSIAQAAEQKIGVIHMQSIFQQLPQREVIQQQLQLEFSDRYDEVKKIQSKLIKLEEKRKRDGALMNDTQKTELIRKAEALQSDYQLKGKALQEDVRRRQGEEENKLLKQIRKAINEVAKADKYDVILQSGAVAYIDKKYDISAKIAAKVSKAK
jgi:outer membrane protein